MAANRGVAEGAGGAEDEARAMLEIWEDYQESIQDCIRESRRESRLEMRKQRMRDNIKASIKERTRERIDYDLKVHIPQTLARAYGLQMIAESC